MRKITFLFAVLLSLAGVTVKAADPVTEGFEYASDGTTVISVNSDGMGLSNGWVVVGSGNYVGIATGTSKDLQLKSGSYVHEGTYSIGTQYSNSYTWLVCPVEVSGTLKFYARRYSSNSSRTLTIGLAVKDGDAFAISNSSFKTYTTELGSEFTEFSVELGDDPVYVAFKPSYAYFDNVTYTPYEQAEGPALAVKDGTTKLTSPYSYNFGLATAGTQKYFFLTNPGTADLTVSVSETGNFGATLSAPTIPANGQVTLTVTMPSTSGSSAVTITPAQGSGIDPFVINVSGTIRDANKVYESGFTALPTDWTTTGTWYYSAENGAYTNAWYLTSNARLITPQLTVAEGETFFVEAKGYSTSNTSYQHLQMQYSADGTTWTNFDSEPTLDPSNWQTFAFTGVPAGKYYIAINASQADVRMFYGGELPVEPKMVVTQPASLDFGVITAATAKTFTIANTGKATLEGINVTSSNANIFAVTGAPTSLEAGASAEVTITMAASTTGALSSDITVSATGMENVQFTVTGVVLPEGMMVVDFNDNQLPANWTNASWTFANGEATGKSYSAYLTTPKLQFSEGDMLVIKAKRADSDATDYITVEGSSDNGETWSAYSKKISGSEGLAYPDYGTLVLTDIPTTVNKLRFVGYYVAVDEIAGLTYAPVLSITQDAAAASTPANYDFGESAADATVTYNFANAGAGTINITNVAITGEGAAAYSTNWTESVAVPFDLVITRTYDAGRTGAQAAVVTVTTTEGDFVINVTGTDKAANDPELAVTPAEDAAFGVVTEVATKTYTVSNAGTGTLTVSIVSDNEMFTVSAAELADIAAGESKTFDVIFTPASETYGVFTANITVKPSYDEAAAVTIAAAAKVKDPALWSEDFAGNALPTGWDAGSNWTIADGVAKAAWTSSSTYLTTPTLSVSGADDELTFDYRTTAGNVNVKIQMSKDNGEWTTCTTTPALGSYMSNGTSGTATITGLEAGVYQFRFANDDYELDNFEGFKLFVPEHKTDIMASSIPASQSWNMTMKEGKSFEATVTLKENAGKEEAVKAELYMGETVIGSVEATLEAYANTTLTIVATPTTAAVEGAQMYIKVTYAGGELTTAAETRYVAALTYLTLDETSSEAVVAGTYDIVTLKRTFNAGWNTVCLPFVVSDVEAFFGEGAKAYTFSSFAEGVLGFNKVESLNASYPYVVYVPAAITEDIALADITIASTDNDPFYTHINNAYFRGTYAPIAAPGMEGKYGVTSEAKIAKGTDAASIKGFRAYFELPAEGGEVKALAFFNGTTGVQTVRMSAAEVEGLFDLSGRKVNAAQKGVYIVNGKKVAVK